MTQKRGCRTAVLEQRVNPGILPVTDGGFAMSQRELIEPHEGDKRYVRRDKEGRFTESDDVSRSLSQDVRQKAKTEKPRNEGDRGD